MNDQKAKFKKAVYRGDFSEALSIFVDSGDESYLRSVFTYIERLKIVADTMKEWVDTLERKLESGDKKFPKTKEEIRIPLPKEDEDASIDRLETLDHIRYHDVPPKPIIGTLFFDVDKDCYLVYDGENWVESKKPKYKIMHEDGCGMVAFYMNKKYEKGDRVLSSDVFNENYEPMVPGSMIKCISCGKQMIPLGWEWIENE